ncbi:MAG: phosphonate ABC transporter ATP-binding protein [Coriobacteriales bacterium]|nr:phosphonate ABC transporter ATP-binding protein [Coriobacteriales bacterium]MDY5662686.1 phosphonate ABC transporter ATP-binding protein [Coriobacteriales bacterium]
MDDTNDLLVIENLTKSYDGVTNALDNANVTVRRGEFVSLIGSSGAGKSTLLRCINRLVKPTSGTVVFDGSNICCARGQKLRHARRRISMVFQHYNLVHRSSVIENVLQGRLGYKRPLEGSLGIYTDEEKQQAVDLLKLVGLDCCTYMRADQLSGGQQQRVGIARAFLQDPLLILADEPIASLDPKSSRIVMEHLRWGADERGITVLASLHQVEYAKEFSDRIVGIRHGKVVFDGTPDELDDAMIASIYDGDDPDEAPEPARDCC